LPHALERGQKSRGAPENQEQQTNIAVDGEKRSIDFGEVVGFDKRMLVGEEERDDDDSGPCGPREAEAPGEPSEEQDHHDVHDARDAESAGHSEAFGDGVEAGLLVEFDVLAGVEDVEASDPERDGGTEDEHARVERAADGDPCGGGRDAEAESEDDVRPGGEALGVGIKEEDGDGDGGEFECEAVELPGGDDEHGGGDEREGPGETQREQAFGQRAILRARICGVVAQVGDAVHGHGGGARANHGDDDPRELPGDGAWRGPGGASGALGEKGADKGEGEREDGVLELDHFEHGGDAAARHS